MDINVNFSYGDESLNNIAFIKALLIKQTIQNLNMNYEQKQCIKKEVLKELKNETNSVRLRNRKNKGVLNEKEN